MKTLRKLKKLKDKKMKKEIKEVEKRYRKQKKIEREVEGYIDNLFKNEMEKRITQYKSMAKDNLNQKSSKTLSEVQDKLMATGFARKSKFISKNIENAEKAVERYEKDKWVPGGNYTENAKRVSTKA